MAPTRCGLGVVQDAPVNMLWDLQGYRELLKPCGRQSLYGGPERLLHGAAQLKARCWRLQDVGDDRAMRCPAKERFTQEVQQAQEREV